MQSWFQRQIRTVKHSLQVFVGVGKVTCAASIQLFLLCQCTGTGNMCHADSHLEALYHGWDPLKSRIAQVAQSAGPSSGVQLCAVVCGC